MILPTLFLTPAQDDGRYYYVYGRVTTEDSNSRKLPIHIRVEEREGQTAGWVLAKPIEADQNRLYCVRVPKGWDVQLILWADLHGSRTVEIASPKDWRVRAPDQILRSHNLTLTSAQALQSLTRSGVNASTEEEASMQLYAIEAMSIEGRLQGSRHLAEAAETYRRSEQYQTIVKRAGANAKPETYRSVLSLLSGAVRDLPKDRRGPILDLARSSGVEAGIRADAIEAWSLLSKPPAPAGFSQELLELARNPSEPLSQAALLALARVRPPEVQAKTMAYIDETLRPDRAGKAAPEAVIAAILAVKNAPVPEKLGLVETIARQDPETSPYGPEIVDLARSPKEGGGEPEADWSPWAVTQTILEAGIPSAGLKTLAKVDDTDHEEWISPGSDPSGGFLRITYRGNPRNGYAQIYVPSPDPKSPLKGGFSVSDAQEVVIRMRSDQETRIGVALQGSNEEGGPVFQPSVGPLQREFKDYAIKLDAADPESLGQVHLVQFNFRGLKDRVLDVQRIYFRKPRPRLK